MLLEKRKVSVFIIFCETQYHGDSYEKFVKEYRAEDRDAEN